MTERTMAKTSSAKSNVQFIRTPSGDDLAVLPRNEYDRLVALAPWPVDWIYPAPAIARRVADLLGERRGEVDHAGAEMIFTSGPRHIMTDALVPFFGGRVPA